MFLNMLASKVNCCICFSQPTIPEIEYIFSFILFLFYIIQLVKPDTEILFVSCGPSSASAVYELPLSTIDFCLLNAFFCIIHSLFSIPVTAIPFKLLYLSALFIPQRPLNLFATKWKLF